MSVTEGTEKHMSGERPFFRKSDFLVVGLVLALACGLFVAKLSANRARPDQDLLAEIYQDNQLLARVPLRGLEAGSYHLADLPHMDTENQLLSSPEPSPANSDPDQAEAGQDQAVYSIEHYLFAADGQGGLKVAEAPCPDRLCERGGYLHQVGDISICVPGQVLVKVVTPDDQAAEADLDIVIGQGKSTAETQAP